MAKNKETGDLAIEGVFLELVMEFAFIGDNSGSQESYFQLLLEPVSKLLAKVFEKKKNKAKDKENSGSEEKSQLN